MSLKQILPQLSALRVEGGDNASWKVLYASRRQPLFVPHDRQRARQAVRFFVRNRLLRYWGQLMLTLDCWLPQVRLLPVVRLQQFPAGLLLGGQVHVSEITNIAMYCGSPGPLQKLTMYCPNRDGEPGLVAKVAMARGANHVIAREADWLSALSGDVRIAQFLPRLLQQGALACDRNYLVMQALPPGFSSAEFDRRHFDFLRLLAQRNPALYAWNQSPAYLRLGQRMRDIEPLIDEPHRLLLQAVLDDIERAIGLRELPACLVHSDFAPWNLRLTRDRLFVFDWEYAEDGGNPLQDFLHFHLLPRALKRLPLRLDYMPGLLANTQAYADTMFGAGSGVAAASSVLTLQYLLETITFYVQVSGYLATEHPVMRTYLKLLEQRAQWLPAAAPDESIDTYDQPQFGAS